MNECITAIEQGGFISILQGDLYLHAINVLDLHGFFGSEGNWGRKRATSLRKSMLEKRRDDKGKANNHTHQSTFMQKGFINHLWTQFQRMDVNFYADAKAENHA